MNYIVCHHRRQKIRRAFVLIIIFLFSANYFNTCSNVTPLWLNDHRPTKTIEMKNLIIVLVLLISPNNVECGSKMAQLLAKASMRSFKKLANKSAKSFIADSLFSGIGSRSHVNNPLANIISTEEYETEVYQIESTLQSRIVAEIPDIQSIMESIDAIKDDWTVREKAIPKDLKILSKELDDFNVLDEFAENGDIESVKTVGNTKIKSANNILKNHLGEAKYDEDFLQANSDGKKTDVECKTAISNIEKLKIKYESANGVYRQIIMTNRQNLEKEFPHETGNSPFPGVQSRNSKLCKMGTRSSGIC